MNGNRIPAIGIPRAMLYYRYGALWERFFEVLGVTAVAPTLSEAVRNAYRAAADVKFEHSYMRHDIGARALRCKGE